MATVHSVGYTTTPVDRFGLTLSLAILIHALIILGISFVEEDTRLPRYETMEIILVKQKTAEPKEAKKLAQANLQGGGVIKDMISPKSSMAEPYLDPKPKTPPPKAPSSEIQESAPVKKNIIEDNKSSNSPTEKLVLSDKMKQLDETRVIPEQKKTRVKKPRMPSASELLTNSFKIASLSAENQLKNETKEKLPKRKHITATTKEYKYAAYMEAWRLKVERIGNINYPEQARRDGLSGSLLLDVALNSDGSINQITIRRSSGIEILDNAAINIVKLAAPYAVFPPQFKNETDILHILRTWQFINKKGFR